MKIRTAGLSGAQLDYWTARAQGVPADSLEIRRVPRTDMLICVMCNARGENFFRHDPSTNWHLVGALIEQHGACPVTFTEDGQRVWGCFIQGDGGHYIDTYLDYADGQGPTPQVAVCRAIVRAAFGDEVEEVPVCK